MACPIQTYKVAKLGFRFYLVTFYLSTHSLLMYTSKPLGSYVCACLNLYIYLIDKVYLKSTVYLFIIKLF